MAISADYFLKYLWWSAFYSGSSGFGSHSQQVQNAYARSTSYLWIVIVLEAVTLALVWSAMKPRTDNSANPVGRGVRVVASLTFTIAGTALLALVLAWIQPGIR
jgi:hypothetical protein